MTKGFNLNSIKLRTVESPPLGFLTISEYGERLDLKYKTILKAIEEKKIPVAKMMRVVKHGKKPYVIVNWNETAYDYIYNKRQDAHPDDFEVNDERVYRPITVEGDDLPEQKSDVKSGKDVKEIWTSSVDSVGHDSLSEDTKTDTPIIDIHDAKLAEAKLKVRKLQAEVNLAENKSILLEDALAEWKSQAIEVRTALRRFINNYKPKLVGLKTPESVETVLTKGINGVLLSLNPEGGEDASR